MSRGGESCGIEAVSYWNNCSTHQKNFFSHNRKQNDKRRKKQAIRGNFYSKEHGTDFAISREKYMDPGHKTGVCPVDKLLAIVILIGRIDYEI
jgi:hypothetical protein